MRPNLKVEDVIIIIAVAALLALIVPMFAMAVVHAWQMFFALF